MSLGPSLSEAMGSPDDMQSGIYRTQKNLNNTVKWVKTQFMLLTKYCYLKKFFNTQYNLFIQGTAVKREVI
jgi:hypothetical protein